MEDIDYLRNQLNVLGAKKPSQPKTSGSAIRWKPSKKGNLYCIIRGKCCVIGTCSTGSWWGMIDGKFLTGYFPNETEVTNAITRELQS